MGQRFGKNEVKSADQSSVESTEVVDDAVPLGEFTELNGVTVTEELLVSGRTLVDAGELMGDLRHEGQAETVHDGQANGGDDDGEGSEDSAVGVDEHGSESGRSLFSLGHN